MNKDMSEQLKESLQNVKDGNYRIVTYDNEGNRTEVERSSKEERLDMTVEEIEKSVFYSSETTIELDRESYERLIKKVKEIEGGN